MKIVLHDDHGGEHDVTEHVRSLYGHTTGSMDWGSGFLDTDEMLEVQEFGYLSGFEQTSLEDELAERRHELDLTLSGIERDRSRYGVGAINDKYWQGRTAEAEAWVKGLEKIRAARARLFQQTDDVTDFDEEQA